MCSRPLSQELSPQTQADRLGNKTEEVSIDNVIFRSGLSRDKTLVSSLCAVHQMSRLLVCALCCLAQANALRIAPAPVRPSLASAVVRSQPVMAAKAVVTQGGDPVGPIKFVMAIAASAWAFTLIAVVSAGGKAVTPLASRLMGSVPFKLSSVITLAIVFSGLSELRKRASIIEESNKCMDEGECEIYDEIVKTTPAWKLRLAKGRLMQSNALYNKL